MEKLNWADKAITEVRKIAAKQIYVPKNVSKSTNSNSKNKSFKSL